MSIKSNICSMKNKIISKKSIGLKLLNDVSLISHICLFFSSMFQTKCLKNHRLKSREIINDRFKIGGKKSLKMRKIATILSLIDTAGLKKREVLIQFFFAPAVNSTGLKITSFCWVIQE